MGSNERRETLKKNGNGLFTKKKKESRKGIANQRTKGVRRKKLSRKCDEFG